MKNLFKNLFIMVLITIIVQNANSQISGIKNIPSTNYPSIAVAIDSINIYGVGSGGVTFNVSAGYTETAANLVVTASGTSLNQIVFQKSGTGANPLITAGIGTGSLDGIIKLSGADYITFDGIDLQESTGNTTTTAQMEWGFALLKPDGTNGSQNNTIINCVITLNKANTSAIGVYVANHTPASTAILTVTAVSGANSNNRFYNNIINNVNHGVWFSGFADASPYSFYDQNNEVGTSGVGRSRIFNFGSTTTSYGIYGTNQNGIKIFNTSLDNQGGAAATGSISGIYLVTGLNSNVDIYSDTITIVAGGTTGAVYGIYNAMGGSGTTNTVNINNNVIQNCTYTTATSAATYYIYHTAGCFNLNINGNRIVGNAYGATATATGTIGFIYTFGGTAANNIWNINNNVISNFTRTQSALGSGLYYGIYCSAAGTTLNMNNNIISDMTVPSTSIFYGIYPLSGVPTTLNINNNLIKNINRPNLSTGGVYAIYHTSGASGGTATLANNSIGDISVSGSGAVWALYSSASMNKNIYGDTIYNLNSTGGTVYGIYSLTGLTTNIYKNTVTRLISTSGTVYGAFITSGTTNNIYNNMISDLQATTSISALGVAGLYASGGTANNIFYNSIYMNCISTSISTFGTAGIYASTAPTTDLRNNIVVNVSTPGPTGGFTVAHYRSSTATGTYASTSNNNLFFAGNPGANRLIYYDLTNAIQILSAYKTFIGPGKDANSVTENPPFNNVTTYPFNLRLNTAIATQCETGGVTVSTPIAITDDIDGQPRFPNPGFPVNPSFPPIAPDIGADEFGGIPLDLNPPAIVYTPLLNTSSTSARTLIATITDPSGVPITSPGWPNLYWKINSGSYTAATPTNVSGSQYTYQLGAGVILGDTVSYYIVARDMNSPTPNIGAFPSTGASGFTFDPPACSTPPTNPSRYIISQSALAGDYTVGLNMFNSITGRNIAFEKVVKKVMKEVPIDEPVVNTPEPKGQEKIKDDTEIKPQISGKTKFVEVEEISYKPVENGREFTGDLYVKKSEHPEYNYPAGVMGVYATITAAVNDLNLRGVSGYTRFMLVDVLYSSETLPIIINVQNADFPTATNCVTIKPGAGLSPVISGAGASTHVFRILTSFVSIDGSNTLGGTTKNLTIQNTSTVSPQVVVIGSTGTTPVIGDSLKNCIFINGANTSSAVIISDGASAGSAGYFNNIVIQNNDFRLSYIALYCNAFVQPGNGSRLRIINNNFNDLSSQVRLCAVYVQGADSVTISGNNIGNMINTTDASNFTGIWLATGTGNTLVSNNNLFNMNGSSAGPRGIAISSAITNANINVIKNDIDSMYTMSSGTAYGVYFFSTTGNSIIQKNKIRNIKNMNTGGYNAHGIDLSSTLTAANVTVQNNFLWNVAAYGYSSTTTWNGYGINIISGGGYNIYFNSINLATDQISPTGTPACLIIGSGVTTASSLNIRNNIFSIPATVGVNRYAVLCNAANTIFANIDYNCYFTSGPNLGFIGSVRTDLLAWRLGTLRDSFSVAGNPQFVNDADLHINPSVPSPVLNAGQFITTVPDDIDDNPRTATPDIGADEYTYVPPPLTGIKTIPGNYTSIQAAINDLNTLGVGTGGVTFNIAAGFADTIPSCGYVINVTNNPPTASNPIVFQKSGTGPNPVISSSVNGSASVGTTTLGGNGCAFFKLVGTDYITFDGLTIQELYTGTTQSLKMQYGFQMVRASSTDGCKNVSILNCNINMRQSNVSSCGIATLNVDATHTTTNPVTIDGRHENISVQGTTINNSFNGMYFVGFNASTPYDLYDHFYNIGTTSANTLINIGSVGVTNTSTHYGIYSLYLDSIRILNNTIRINTGDNSATSYGVFLSTALNSSADIIGNTVSDTAGGTTSQLSGITCGLGGTGTSNTVNINNNVVQYCRYLNATTATNYYIYVTSNPFNLNISGNIIRDNSIGGGTSATGTGAQYGIWTSSTNSTTGSIYNVSNNTVKTLSRIQSAAGAGTTYGIYMSGAGQTTNVNGNLIDSIANASTTGGLAGIYYSPSVTQVNIFNNTVSNLAKLTGATTGALYGIFQSNSSATSNNYGNTIFNLSNGGTTAVTYGYYNFGVGTIAENVYNNNIYNISSVTSGVLIGLFACTGSTTSTPDKDIYGNNIYNLVQNGTGQTGAIQVNYADTAKIHKNKFYNIRTNNAAGSPAIYGMYLNNTNPSVVYIVYNNMLHELYAPVSATGLGVLGIWVNGGLASHITYNSIYLDSTSTGTNFGAYVLYFSGTTTARIRNNILVNKTVPTGTGTGLLIFKSSTVIYDTLLSNNNCFFIPQSTNNYYFYDGTNLYQTITDFKTRVAPAESNSFSEQPPFINIATSPYNLHLANNIPTKCESGAERILTPIPIPRDIDDTLRWGEPGYTGSGTAPDIGADEGNFASMSVLSLNLKVYLEGFWNGTTQVVDTAKIYIANSTSPYAFVDSQKVVLSNTGTASMNFTKSSGSYYIVVKHRNHLETWSRLPQTFVAGTPLAYDFTTDSAKAYGFNMRKVGSIWTLFAGDANQDGSVDALDVAIFITQFGSLGYLSCDFNGDNSVDALDVIIFVGDFGLTKSIPTLATLPADKRTREQIKEEIRMKFETEMRKINNNSN